jgi:hypothetical protein
MKNVRGENEEGSEEENLCRNSRSRNVDHNRRGARYEIRTQQPADSPAYLPHVEGRMGRRLHTVHRCDASTVARRHFALADRAADRIGYDDARYKMPVEDFHRRGVRVLFPMMMWDQGTREPGKSWPDAIAEVMKEVDADGVNGDTQDGVPLAFSLAADRVGHPL